MTTPGSSVRQAIFNAVDDLVADLLYYGRKGDETLPVGVIEDAVSKGDITVDEIIERFRAKMTEHVK